MSQEKASIYAKLKAKPSVPIDLRSLKPDRVAGLKSSDIKNIKIMEGGRETVVEEIFEVESPAALPQNPENIEIIISGDGASKIRYLGYKMNGGRIVVEGNIGPLAGYKMSRGSIVIKGSAGNWLGARMKGGSIEVFGDAGSFIGAKLPGEKFSKGMKDGTITIHGSAGSYIGLGMGGGTIIVEKSAGNMVGGYMAGGLIIVQGDCGDFIGARMSGGRIIAVGRVGGILPSFYIDSVVGEVRARGRIFKKPFALFVGDVLTPGRGTIAVSLEENKTVLQPLLKLIEEVKVP
ncbi:MAG: formylmethanofuran dehydrogenase subunit C [Ignisphaera sp.]|nr:formylmethanofuran dehydrogenase subunit C [Ignisphaera sp.]MCX8168252.1 formylmethanofuran dehydrogenase subunit C [Ignisphaera sp.]MDW8084880.1 formylmethanofuran dehydrogenase subunit C [Ignisphaera sp.]